MLAAVRGGEVPREHGEAALGHEWAGLAMSRRVKRSLSFLREAERGRAKEMKFFLQPKRGKK